MSALEEYIFDHIFVFYSVLVTDFQENYELFFVQFTYDFQLHMTSHYISNTTVNKYVVWYLIVTKFARITNLYFCTKISHGYFYSVNRQK